MQQAIPARAGGDYAMTSHSTMPDPPQSFSEGIVGIDQHGNAHGSRLQLVQQPKLLCPKLRHNEGDAGDVAARPVETGDEAKLNRVAAACEDDTSGQRWRMPVAAGICAAAC